MNLTVAHRQNFAELETHTAESACRLEMVTHWLFETQKIPLLSQRERIKTRKETNLCLQVHIESNENSDSVFMAILTGSLKSCVSSKHTIDLAKR